MSSFRFVGFLSLFSRYLRSRSRRRSSLAFFSSSVKGFSMSRIDDSEFLRGRASRRRDGDRFSSEGPLPCIFRARSASSWERVGRWLGPGGPRRPGGGIFSLPGGGRRFGGGRRREPSVAAPGGGVGFFRSTAIESFFSRVVR